MLVQMHWKGVSMSEAAWKIVCSWLAKATLWMKEEEKRSHLHGVGSMPSYGSIMICQAGWMDLICWIRELAGMLEFVRRRARKVLLCGSCLSSDAIVLFLR